MSSNEDNGGGWLMDYGLLDEFPVADYIWSPQFLHDPAAPRLCECCSARDNMTTHSPLNP